jgi:hypothetical protein
MVQAAVPDFSTKAFNSASASLELHLTKYDKWLLAVLINSAAATFSRFKLG